MNTNFTNNSLFFKIQFGQLYYYFKNNTQVAQYFEGPSIPLNTWTHVAVTHDFNSGNILLFKNGVLTASTNIAMKVSNISRSTARIGDDGTGYPFEFKGDMDDVYIYNRALTQSEINSLYTQ